MLLKGYNYYTTDGGEGTEAVQEAQQLIQYDALPEKRSLNILYFSILISRVIPLGALQLRANVLFNQLP